MYWKFKRNKSPSYRTGSCNASLGLNKAFAILAIDILVIHLSYSKCTLRTVAPKGMSEIAAILKHCNPTGNPTIVMHHKHPVMIHESQLIKPPHIIQSIFPKILMIIISFAIFVHQFQASFFYNAIICSLHLLC